MARSDKDFLGLEVIGLDDASLLGEVDGLIVDETTKRVAGLIIDMGLYEASVLPFDRITALGEDAVLVESAEAVRPLSQEPELEAVAQRSIQLDELLILTDGGDVVGMVGDYFVNPGDGSLAGIEIVIDAEAGEETHVVPISAVVSIGTDLVMVSSKYRTMAVGGPDDL